MPIREPKRSNQQKKRSLKFLNTIIILIVLSLISVLLFVWLTSPERRDKKRIEELKELREALFFYYNENGRYPNSVSDWSPESPDYGADPVTGANDYDNLASFVSPPLPDLPNDPLNETNSPVVSKTYLYRYVSSIGGRNFALVYETENRDDDSPQVMLGW